MLIHPIQVAVPRRESPLNTAQLLADAGEKETELSGAFISTETDKQGETGFRSLYLFPQISAKQTQLISQTKQ